MTLQPATRPFATSSLMYVLVGGLAIGCSDGRLVNTAARRCLYDARLAGEDAQLTILRFTDSGPLIGVIRTTGGTVEPVRQDLRPPVSGELVVTECTRLVLPSQLDQAQTSPDVDAMYVFVTDPESCF